MTKNNLFNKICSGFMCITLVLSSTAVEAQDIVAASTLAPWSKIELSEFKNSLTVAAICRRIETDGNLGDTSTLKDVLARLDTPGNPNIKALPHEVVIEIPAENLAVRYYDPAKAACLTPYSDISGLTTHVINSEKLVRQIINRKVGIPQTSRDADRKKQIEQWKKPVVIELIDRFKGIKGHLRRFYGYSYYKLQSLRARWHGKIGTFMITRGLSKYDLYTRYLKKAPILQKGFRRCVENCINRNNRIGQTTCYLDAGGGIGRAANEFVSLYGKRQGKAYVVDINEWTLDDLTQNAIDMARQDGRSKLGVEDNLTRQFEFIKSDITTVTMPEKMDIITAFACLHFVDNPLAAIVNLYNQLKVGGVFIAHYPVPTSQLQALDGFYEALACLSALGADVECATVMDKNYLDGTTLDMVIVKNDARDVKLNLIPDHRDALDTVPERKGLSTKAVYYRNDSGRDAVEFMRDEDKFTETDRRHMAELVEFAKAKIASGELGREIPVVARIVDGNGNVVVTSMRTVHPQQSKYGVDAVHGEIQAIRDAEKIGFSDWENATIYINMDSCYNCSRALTEFYGFKRVVYGVKDTTLSEFERNGDGYRMNNVELVDCTDEALRSALTNLFNLQSEVDFGEQIPSYNAMLERELKIAVQFRREYQRTFNEDVQVILFDADLWVQEGSDPWQSGKLQATKERMMFRHLEWLKQDLNPAKKHVLLIVGNSENSKRARERIIKDRICDDVDILLYNPNAFPKAVTYRPVIDMHIHSTFSDGELTPKEIIKQAREGGIKAISITDHDTLSAYIEDPNIFEFARNEGVELIAGSEITSLCYEEGLNDGYYFSDLVALFPKLNDETDEDYMIRLKKVNDMLRKDKMAFKRCVLSTIAQFKKDSPQANIDFKALLNAGINADVKKHYPAINLNDLWAKLNCKDDDEFIENVIRGPDSILEELPKSLSDFHDALVYVIQTFENTNTPLPEEVSSYEAKSLSGKLNQYILNHKDKYFGDPNQPGNFWKARRMEEAITLVKENRGFVFFAHPHGQRLAMGSDRFEQMIRSAKKAGLDGIEAFSRGHTGVDSLYYNGLAVENRLLVTNGSDFHGPNVHPEPDSRHLGTGRNTKGNQTSKEMLSGLGVNGIISKDILKEFDKSASANSPLKNQVDYIAKNKALFQNLHKVGGEAALMRVPIEAIESIGENNIKNFLSEFQAAPNGYVELYYMSGVGEVGDGVYAKYGLVKKALPKSFSYARDNTVTLFPAFKGRDEDAVSVAMKLGSFEIKPTTTILSPIGLQNDQAGLVRAAILGLKLMMIAREINKNEKIIEDQAFKDKEIQLEILEQLKNIFGIDAMKEANLTPVDIVTLLTGTKDKIIGPLNKLIKLLPITPFNEEELRMIYERMKEVLTAA